MSRLSKIGAAALAAFGWSGGTSVSASYLVVAGGGSGGYGNGGGGGAGGLLSGTASLNPTLSYTVIVGAGGASAVASGNGNQGSNSQLGALTAAVGGGYGGGGQSPYTGGTGGSGGGSGSFGSGSVSGGSGTSGQGNNGGGNGGFGASGYPGGGGGGAGTAGSNATSTSAAGNGGAGVSSTISGTSVYYAGGGGGGISSGTAGTGGNGGGGNGGSGAVGSNGTANTGGGGGGAASATSGQGGSGVVIISYPAPQKFGGGVVTTDGTNIIHTFNTSGTLAPLNSLTASYLIVAGGGGSGGSAPNYVASGGGGAGGLISGSGLTIDTNSTYLVTVGAGGAGGAAGFTNGNNGGNSAFSLVSTQAIGGALGQGYNQTGATGGSGGGGANNSQAGSAGTSGQGYAGGNGGVYSNSNSTQGAGGGGGAGGVGGNFSGTGSGGSNNGGAGGVGVASSISGTSTYYAGGGGGGAATGTGGAGGNGGGGAGNSGWAATGSGTAGTANTGGGGGGSSSQLSTSYAGAAGGSGIVIISYPGSTQQMAGGTVTIVGGNVIHTFTSSGYLSPLTFVGNSLRFRQSNSAYLSRTMGTPTDGKKVTVSMWFKRGALSYANCYLIGCYPSSGASDANTQGLYFNSNDTLGLGGYSTNYRTTNQVFRDPAAWYHLVYTYDSTQATASNRETLYLNGVQITSFSTSNDVSQNTTNPLTASGSIVAIGTEGQTLVSGRYFDGEMAEVRLIDGQALTPNSFGTFNSYGVWQPINYGGSYGTNGFYLPFNTQTSINYAGNFSGSGQYITSSSGITTPGTGNYTLECWYCPSVSSPSNSYILDTGTGNQMRFQLTSNNLYFAWSGASAIYIANAGNSAGTWYHVAAVRNGTTLTLYLNGNPVATTTDSTNLTGITSMRIGDYALTGGYGFAGSVSNVRLVNNAVYTAPFTPSTTPLTAVSGTQILTLQNSTIVDNSPNALTFTNTGSVATGNTYPFAINLFKDQSPQGNNWNSNGMNGGYGAALDYMTDVPTLTSATAANYAVLNPLASSPNDTLSNGNLTWSGSNTSNNGTVASMAITSGSKAYWELTCTTLGSAQLGVTACTNISPSSMASTTVISDATTAYVYSANGVASPSGTAATSYASGDVLGFACDYTGSYPITTIYKNGTSVGTCYSTTVPSGPVFPYLNIFNTVTINANFGQQPFKYTPPSGFVALNTYNL